MVVGLIVLIVCGWLLIVCLDCLLLLCVGLGFYSVCISVVALFVLFRLLGFVLRLGICFGFILGLGDFDFRLVCLLFVFLRCVFVIVVELFYVLFVCCLVCV